MAFLPKLIYSFNKSLSKYHQPFLEVDIDELILNFKWKCRELRLTKTVYIHTTLNAPYFI